MHLISYEYHYYLVNDLLKRLFQLSWSISICYTWYRLLYKKQCRQTVLWRDVRVVEGGGLENRCALAGTGGSNPSPSANPSIDGLADNKQQTTDNKQQEI